MFSATELAQWTSRAWKFMPPQAVNAKVDFPIVGISHDTRTLKAGDVYIAIKGERFDGHDFVGQAVEKGAAGLIVERHFPDVGKPQLIVPNGMDALWQMAAGVRREWAGPVIGITGSVGKTTVKEMVASVLVQKGPVAKTPGNWNNDIGLPLSMLAADRASDYFVFELGMNHPGEIDRLSGLLEPEWALITNIGKAHIGFFQDLEEIADEKGSILNHAAKGLLDKDSEWFERITKSFSGPVVTLTEEQFAAPQPGAHMVQNARFAATLGLELGLTHVEVQRGLDSFTPAPMRWDETEQNGIIFINDAYNANPLSMRAALSTFSELPCEGRKFLVLGGMNELGEQAEFEHRALREFVNELGFDRVLFVGGLWGAVDAFGKAEATQILYNQLRASDKVFFKGSRSERLETILEELRESFTKS